MYAEVISVVVYYSLIWPKTIAFFLQEKQITEHMKKVLLLSYYTPRNELRRV